MNRRVFGATAAAACVALGALTGAALAGDGHGTPPGQAQQSGNTTTTNNSTGVKPSNNTSKNTHAAAGSNKTKLYGNGTTAGQIATSRGASPDTDLYGPGNSQPHKVAVCKNGKTHYVDVHAVKSYGSVGACKSGPVAAQATAPAVAATSGVLGARATVQAPAKAATPRGGVLGTTARTGTLPFTGLPLWLPALAALGLLGLGAAIRWRVRSSEA
jgi:hypothetical protein